ncbi:MAG: PEGA domain-containing protein [Candidatus Solibacter usitatus]|nr:PEGA domain-containing protein [Candidatus Solibacter usitatus]
MLQAQRGLARVGAALGLVLFCASLPLAAKAKKDTGTLEPHVSPGRAGVFVDGKYLGPAANFGFARKYELTPGEHKLLLTDPRNEDYATTIQIEAGKTLRVDRTLAALPLAQPPFAQLKAKSDSKFDGVWVNGKFMGHVDEFDNPYQFLLLPPGSYTVRIAAPNGDTKHEEKVTLTANQTTIVTAGAKK